MDDVMARNSDRLLLVLEDDFEAAADFAERLPAFLAALPDDWQIAYLGCQHIDSGTRPPDQRCTPGVLRAVAPERTHAMLIHPRFFAELRSIYETTRVHIDWRLREVTKEHRFYAADPPLAAQGENDSLIENQRKEHRDWRIMNVPHFKPTPPAQFDRVVVINLPARTDRRAAFTERLSRSALLSAATVEWFPALSIADVVVPTWWKHKPGYFACRASHLAVWAAAIRDKLQNVLIFEDDAEIHDNFDARLQALASAMPADWYGYQLGGFLWPSHASQRVAAGVQRLSRRRRVALLRAQRQRPAAGV